MANKIIACEFGDWSQISKKDPFFEGLDLSRDENFGIHVYNGSLWTSGYVGVGRLYGANGRPLNTQGREHVAIVRSRYQMDPWIMLEKVMTDAEYEDYLEELEKDGKYLFRIFYDRPVIKLAQDQNGGADILYALSFINLCYSLCKKGVRKRMFRQEGNFNSRIRGKVEVGKNLRKNTCKGRNDRFFCSYIEFTADTVENRIVKAALMKCKNIVEKKFNMNSEIVSRLCYCKNVLRGVKSIQIRNKDFNRVSAGGLYTYYKPLLQQAKCILRQKYVSYATEDGRTVNRSVYTIPYMINMEAVFEFYVRTVIRESLDPERYYLERYSKKIFLERGAASLENAGRGIHLTPYCIPDVILCEKATRRPVMVMDAKYKQDDRPVRSDTHQLLSYVLLTGAPKCGFVLPGKKTAVKQMGEGEFMEICTPLMQELKYYELILGNEMNASELQKMLI